MSSFSLLWRHMRSIRCVTPKPPATLSIARTIARKPSALLPRDTAAPVAASAPSTVMPDRAFMPDISGVCRRLGTFLINRYPTTVATIKISTKMIGCI